MSKTSHLEMVHTTHLWRFGGWFMMLLTTVLAIASQSRKECGRLRMFLRCVGWPFHRTARSYPDFYTRLSLAIHPRIYHSIFQGMWKYYVHICKSCKSNSIFTHHPFFVGKSPAISFCQRSHGPVSEAARARGLATARLLRRNLDICQILSIIGHTWDRAV